MFGFGLLWSISSSKSKSQCQQIRYQKKVGLPIQWPKPVEDMFDSFGTVSLANFSCLLFFLLLQRSYQFTPLEAAISATTLNVEHYVTVTDQHGQSKRIVVDYFENHQKQAQEFCLGTATDPAASEITTDQQQCLHQLTPLLASKRQNLILEVEQRASKGIIGNLNLHLKHSNNKDGYSLKHPLQHGGLHNTPSDADVLCDTHDIDFVQCDSLRSAFVQEYIDAEKKSLVAAIDLVFHHQHLKQHIRTNDTTLEQDLRELHQRVETSFQTTATLILELEKYISLRIEHHVQKQIQTRDTIDSLKRELILLEEYNNIRSKTQEMHLIPIRRINASQLTYAEYLRYASRSEPLIIIDDSIHSTEAISSSTKIPGLPKWTKEHMISTCSNISFTLKKKATVDATKHWARLERVGNMTIEHFYNAIEHPKNKHDISMSNGYLHDQNLALRCPKLLDDVIVPSWFTNDLMQRTPSKTTNHYWHRYVEMFERLKVENLYHCVTILDCNYR